MQESHNNAVVSEDKPFTNELLGTRVHRKLR